MVAAILTTLLWALSGVTNQRVAVTLGSQWGSFIRLVFACVILATVTLVWMRDSLQPDVFRWFFLSGIIGFGLGDVALFAALARIGSRLTILLTLCLAPIFALLVEWVWLHQLPDRLTIGCMLVILVGVAMSVGASVKTTALVSLSIFGVAAAIVSGFGQGFGAVLSVKAEQVAIDHGVVVSGVSAAFQRIFAGVIFGGVVVAVLRWGFKSMKIPGLAEHLRVNGWLIGAVLTGPVLGVSCYQWALQTLPSSIVLAIVALTPIVLMPIAVVTEKDRPSVMAVVGAIIAVGGVSVYFALVKSPG